MISAAALWRWAVTSNDRAVANARAAATECSRRRVERAEVDALLTAYAERPSAAAAPTGEAAANH